FKSPRTIYSIIHPILKYIHVEDRCSLEVAMMSTIIKTAAVEDYNLIDKRNQKDLSGVGCFQDSFPIASLSYICQPSAQFLMRIHPKVGNFPALLL
ncbi:MAG: hypothetical protein EZS28_039059, partial [Streblomastix strix]